MHRSMLDDSKRRKEARLLRDIRRVAQAVGAAQPNSDSDNAVSRQLAEDQSTGLRPGRPYCAPSAMKPAHTMKAL